MTRKSILKVTEEVLKTLKKDEELTIKSISKKVDSQWRTTLKSLEFLKGVGLVRERKGKKTNKEERLFSLSDAKVKYGKH
ncbi:MAG TPA: winged helix DNA-binding protein [Candidatus Nanoarchaeia archaeon]|nr:winged helix DNA-binding protein [Candidatus Nanoarchaeia archaeon]